MKKDRLELPREAVTGLINALEDIRNGEYVVLSSAPKKEKGMIDAILEERIKEINNLKDYDEKMKRIRINEAQTFAQKWMDSRKILVSQLMKQEKITARKSKNLKEVNKVLNKLLLRFWGRPLKTNGRDFDNMWNFIKKLDKNSKLLEKNYALGRDGE